MPVTTVIGCQWGDEGKGKIVDLLSASADVVARYQGGPNAGHTVVVNGEQTVLHQIPSGILHPDVICCLGNGCVIDPRILLHELENLDRSDISTEGRVKISPLAHLIMPYHRAIDDARETAAGVKRIGTTGKGIGPAYTDKYRRCGIRFGDLFSPEGLEKVLTPVIEENNRLLVEYYHVKPLKTAKLIEEFEGFKTRLEPYQADVSLLLDEAIRKKQRIVLEGAQGTLLDIDHGTYPFVTSSNPTSGMSSTGTGIGPRKIDRVLGVLKAYTTRVGNGPFPTELQGELQESFRSWGGEYGATTGRARRCGWLDLVIARYSVRVNSVDSWMLTKLDVLSGLDEIQVCTAYGYRGEK